LVAAVDPLLNALRARERRALSRAITLVENRAPGFDELLAGVYPHTGTAFRVGITGPPGAGKSTLVDGLAAHWSAQGQRVGIIAVDPTSPFSGGALLGDRVRMGDLSSLPDVYIRSMATRGSLGGLAAATRDVSMVMDAFGFDWLLIETVGVGQIELEIMNVCDSVTVVFVPESGDGVQALKAGLIEIAHIYVVNKADRSGAEQLATELGQAVTTKRERERWDYPVITAEAVHRKGVTELAGHLERHRGFLGAAERLPRRRREQALTDLENILRERVHTYLLQEEKDWLDELSGRIASGSLDPHRAAHLVWQRLLAREGTPTTRSD
jgi:LAO/AO transport system kinase